MITVALVISTLGVACLAMSFLSREPRTGSLALASIAAGLAAAGALAIGMMAAEKGVAFWTSIAALSAIALLSAIRAGFVYVVMEMQDLGAGLKAAHDRGPP